MHDFNQSRIPARPTKKRKGEGAILGIIALILITLPLYSLFMKPGKQNPPSSPPIRIGNSLALPLIKKKTPKDITRDIEAVYKDINGSYSVYAVNVNTNESFGIDEKVIFTGASVNKVAILATLYNLAGKNEIDLEKIISLQEGDIQDYGSGSIRYDQPGTPYSLKTLARLMMEKSDNTASHILANLVIGMDKIQEFTDSLGMTQTDMADNKTSPYDMSLLMIKLYKGEVTTKALTAEMLSIMDNSDFDDRIPQGLPTGIKYYHKTGDETGKLHDVAIVDLPGKPYFLGVFTTDITNEEKTKENIAAISKIVYDYMNN